MIYKRNQVFRIGIIALFALLMSCESPTQHTNNEDRIQPYVDNPFYWQYKGEPLLLLGGTWQENLFNHPIGLERHLDRLKSFGGNYVRNTMSHRNDGNLFAYTNRDGKFDLDEFNIEYWQRFDDFLRMTHERGIIVQIEVWETWDLYEDHQSLGGWSKHPFNPENNVNYTAEESGLPIVVDYPPAWEPTDHTFFRTVPELDNNIVALPYQQAFVDKLLFFSLQYDHVLYCMNNETGELHQWGDYWAGYIQAKAREEGKLVVTGDMRRNHDVRHADHDYLYQNPELYMFVDISQNTVGEVAGQEHWDRLQWVRDRLMDHPRPINHTKIYGGGDEAANKMWRNIFGGSASSRFHRPHPHESVEYHEKSSGFGLGLGPIAQAHILSLRMLTDSIDVFSSEPRNDLLSGREPNEAYCFAQEGETCVLYFPNGGTVTLNLTNAPVGEWKMRWLNILESSWDQEQTLQGGIPVEISTPGEGDWAALILPSEKL